MLVLNGIKIFTWGKYRRMMMGIEINLDPDKRLMPLSAVPSLLAELTGVTRTRNTIYNWAKKGCRTMDGRLVKLKTTTRMNQVFTTKQNVIDFISEVG